MLGACSGDSGLRLEPELGMALLPHGFELRPAASGSGDSSSECRSPEVPQSKASDRDARIAAEKQRRCDFNGLVTQMMSLVSDVVQSQRKVDKTSVLRLAANKLRNEYVFGDTITCGHTETWSSSFVKIFELFGGFMISFTCRGRIICVSPNVQEKMGHCHIDLFGQDVYNYVHPEDKEILRRHIYPPELKNGYADQVLGQKHDFVIRLMRAGARSDPPRYERCRIDGNLRRSDGAATNSCVEDEKIIRRQRVRHHRTYPSSGNEFVFVGMVRLLTTPISTHRILPPTAYSEYWTRHLIDGRIVQCDQSISLVAGYMTDEVNGTSAFVFMHKDDVRWVICVLRQMYDQNREFGESYYRLMNRSGNFIYMRTRGFLEIDKNTKQVQSFVCVNSVIGEDHGKRMMDEMKRKYSVLVNMDLQTKEDALGTNEAPVEHPKRLERIVMHLVEPPLNEAAEDLKLVPPSKENIITAILNSGRVVHETGVRFDSRKRKLDDTDCDNNNDDIKRHSGTIEHNY